MAMSIKNLPLNPVILQPKEEIREQKLSYETETRPENEEIFELTSFQRKAYRGNFFAGPCILLNPDLFE
ncbi:MAG: hypothetical protein ACHQF0_14095 [Chitinophagales bacterium]